MKEQIVFNLDPQLIKAIMADREREAQRTRLVLDARRAKQFRSGESKTEGRRRGRIRLRNPLKAGPPLESIEQVLSQPESV